MEKVTAEDFGLPLLESLIATAWFQTRPAKIQQMILDYPPNVLYKFKDSGRVVYLYSYCEDNTVSVIHTGYGSWLAPIVKDFRVFGVKPEDLEALSPEETAEILNKLNHVN